MKKGLLTALIGVGLVLVLALALPLASGCGGAPEEEKVYTICISQIVTHPELDCAREGFIATLEEEGFKEGVNVDYIMRNAAGDMSINAAICDYFASIKPDLILSITTPCSQAMKAAVEGTTIPCVFTCVTDPVSAGIIPSWTESEPYYTGVSDWNDITTQMEFIQEISPFKTLGIIYNTGEVNSMVQRNELVEEVAPKLGFTVIEATAVSTADVLGAATSLVGRVDAMWIPTDNVANAAIGSIIQVCEENDIPFFGSAPGMSEQGCIASCGVNECFLGNQAGEMAVKILRGEATPGDITPEKGKYFLYCVNLGAAERMGVTIPQAVIDKADFVYEE